MEKLWQKYLDNKKITIPVTVVIAGLVIGGIAYGVMVPNKKADVADTKTKTKTEKVVTPEYICYDTAGTYSDKETYDAGDITADGVTVENATFNTLTITEAVGDGSVTLNNDTVKKTLVVNGGGQNSLHVNGGSYKEIISNDYDCHIVIDEDCSVDNLTVPSSALVEVNGSVKTANVVPSTYEGEITWETGFKAGEKANISALNIAEDVKDSVAVEDVTGNAVKEAKTLSKEQTAKVQTSAEKTVAAAANNTTAAKTEVVNNGGNTSASTNTSASAGNTNTNTSASASNTNTSSNTNTMKCGVCGATLNSVSDLELHNKMHSSGSSSSYTGGSSYTPPEYVTCDICGNQYTKGENHKCTTYTCGVCGETYIWAQGHDCPYTKDVYGNYVRKDSKYVVRVGNYGCLEYSDGTYLVTDEARRECAHDYEVECMLQGGDQWGGLDNYIIADTASWRPYV